MYKYINTLLCIRFYVVVYIYKLNLDICLTEINVNNSNNIYSFTLQSLARLTKFSQFTIDNWLNFFYTYDDNWLTVDISATSEKVIQKFRI